MRSTLVNVHGLTGAFALKPGGDNVRQDRGEERHNQADRVIAYPVNFTFN